MVEGKEDQVSAIVVNYNGGAYLDDCLSSLLRQSHVNLEVILVDNVSTDGSVEHVRDKFPEVRVIENERNIGYGAAVNRGVALSKSSYIIPLSYDLRLDEYCISELVRLVNQEGVGAAQAKLLDAFQPGLINYYGHVLNFLGMACCGHINEPDRADLKEEEIPAGNHVLVRRGLFERLGGFDENIFLYQEDTDLCWRIRLLGKKIMISPRAVMYHKYDFWRNPNKFYHSEKARAIMLMKNYSLSTLLLIAPAAFLLEAAEFVHALMYRWFWRKVKSYGEIVVSLPSIIKKRRLVQRDRVVNDRQIVSLFIGPVRLTDGSVTDQELGLIDWLLNPVVASYWRLVKGII